MEGLRHSQGRDAEAIQHHYDVSNRFYELVLGPSMTYTCAVYPTADATLEEAQFEKYDLVARKLGPPARAAAARRGLRLGRHGAACRQGVRRQGARGDPVPAAGRVGAARDQERRPRPPGRGAASWTTATWRSRTSTRSPRSGSPSTSACGTTRRTSASSATSSVPGRLLNHCITRHNNVPTRTGAFIDRYVFPDGELIGSGTDHHRHAGRRPRGATRGEPPIALREDAGRLVPQPRDQLGRAPLPRSARASRGSGASTWPGPASVSNATRSSCTTSSRPRPMPAESATSRFVPTGEPRRVVASSASRRKLTRLDGAVSLAA